MSANSGNESPSSRSWLGPELLGVLLGYVRDEVKGCLGAGMSTATNEPKPLGAIGLAEKLDALQREVGEGPAVLAAANNEATSSADLATDERWPALAERIPGDDPVAVVAVAGSWDDEGPIVLTVYLDHEPTAQDLNTIERVEPMLAMSAAMVEYCSAEILRADQLLQMVEHRRIIEQAKGMIMAASRCAADTAFRSLVVASQHFNVKLRDLAVATVELVGNAPAEQPPPELVRSDGIAPAGDKAQLAAQRMWAALHEQ